MHTNDNTFLIEKLKHDLTQDLDQWLEFEDLTEEEQNDICEVIAEKEYCDDDFDYNLADDCGIYENASEQMGYIDPGYKENRKDLQYNLNYGQGDCAYLTGDFDLIKMISNQRPEEKQLIKDLKYLHKQVCGGKWEQYLNGYADYQDNLYDFLNYGVFTITRGGGFYNRHVGGGHHKSTADLNCEEFVNALENFTIKGNKNPACVMRIIEAIDGGVIEGFFADFEDDLKRELYKDLKGEAEYYKECWIEDLKDSLKGKYNRTTKQFLRNQKITYTINN